MPETKPSYGSRGNCLTYEGRVLYGSKETQEVGWGRGVQITHQPPPSTSLLFVEPGGECKNVSIGFGNFQ